MIANAEETAARLDDRRFRTIYAQAPAWAQLLLKFHAVAVPRDVLDAVLDTFEQRGVDWSHDLGDGYRLLNANGASWEELERRGWPAEKIRQADAVLKTYAHPGIEHDEAELARRADAKAALVRQAAATVAAAASVPAAADPAKTPEPGPQTVGTANALALADGRTVVAGRAVADMAGLPKRELLKIDGISPAVADELAKLKRPE